MIKRIIAILMTILILFSLFQGTLRRNVAKADSQSVWPMFGYDAQHTGQCQCDASNNNGKLKWKFKTNAAIQSSPAIGSDSTVYVGSHDGYHY